jgi:Mg2+-importing ATPase
VTSAGAAPGLSSAAAGSRLAEQGPNAMPDVRAHPVLDLVRNQLSNRLVLLLGGAAIVAWALGDRLDAAVILAIVGLNALLGFAQEYRAERAMRALRAVLAHRARVRRDGRLLEIDAREVVRDDIVRVQIGDRIPADVRLLAADDFTADEASLTGESAPVEKRVGQVAFAATTVASGWGEGVVVATGAATAFGHSAAALQAPAGETDFQKNLRRFSGLLLQIALGMMAFVFLANALLGKSVLGSFLFAVALAVGIAPEALPAIITVALSSGALQLARAKVIVRRLIAVEDLGNVDVLCCDKTGTLTEGTLSLADWVSSDGRREPAVRAYGLLSGGADLADPGAVPPNAVDQAIWNATEPAERARWARDARVLDRNEFDFDRRRMSALVRESGRTLLAVKGAPESVLAASCDVRVDGATRPLTPDDARVLTERIATFERAGRRVLMVATRELPAETATPADETGLTVQGLLLLVDAPKPSARESLHELAELGVALKVLSGDSATVTRAVCAEVGLPIAGDRVVTGDDLAAATDDALRDLVRACNVFARVTPEQKLRLVRALRAEGHVVGFLGDGVNDAPALRAADVGIAVDTGAGVAKEAADIVLLEKSLAVLAQGIVGGRRTFGNITKYILNTMSANVGNMTTVAASSLFLPFIPLLPGQILLNNLVSDVPLMALSTDNVEADLLKRPRRWHLDLIVRFMVAFGLLSVVFDLALIFALTRVLRVEPALFRTAWFVESACSVVVVTFAIRSRAAFWRSRPGRWLVVLSAVALVTTVVLPVTGLGARYFAFVPLPAAVLALIAGLLAAYFAAAELAKRWFFRRFEL